MFQKQTVYICLKKIAFMMHCIIISQALGQAVKPIENARYEAYQMRVQGRNYNTNAADNTNANHALESMMRPEVLNIIYFVRFKI